MRREKGIRVIISFLCLILIIQLTANVVYAKAAVYQDNPTQSTVTFLVELEEESIINLYAKTETANYEQFLETNMVKQKETKQLEEQAKISDIVQEQVRESADVCKYQYTSIMNGFSIQAPINELDKIRKIDGVKNVYISKQYEPCESETTEKIEGDNENCALKYSGSGSIISVIDTGIDINHEKFQQVVSAPKLTEESVQEIDSLHADSGKYQNSRFPFCYDYADGDNDIIPTQEFASENGFHGTAVSSIIADNASDVQILGMKVFSDNGGKCEEASVLAAIEDSVRLGADVINLSLGSVSGFSASSNDMENEIYGKVKALGIEIAASAGNYFSSYLGNCFNGYGFASNPDSATICQPASFEACTAVAASSPQNGMLDMSSWGVSPNLALKPEVSAPGDNVNVAMPFGKYDYKSGTSLATPLITAYYAILKSHIRKDKKYSALTDDEKGKLAVQLLMSTAQIKEVSSGMPYSPRKQGSGEADIENALKTNTFLYSKSAEYEKPKLNLYDDYKRAGVFSETFHIKNISDTDRTYAINNISLAQNIVTNDKEIKFFDGTECIISNDVSLEVVVDGKRLTGQSVIVPASKDITIKVTFRLKDQLKSYYDANMENGGFFEGYLLLNSASDEMNLTIPYVGFYGDWTEAPLFDTGWAHDEQLFSLTSNKLYSKLGEEGRLLGVNPFDTVRQNYIMYNVNPIYYIDVVDNPMQKPDKSKIVISPNGDGRGDEVELMQLSLLRNVKNLSVEVEDEHGNQCMYVPFGNVKKTTTRDGTKYNMSTFEINKLLFENCISQGKNNSTYFVTVCGQLDYDRHISKNKNDKITFPITIDIEKPNVLSAKAATSDSEQTLHLKVWDNQYVATVVAIAMNKETGEYQALDQKLLCEKEKNKESEIELNIARELESQADLSEIKIVVSDYACNQQIYDLSDLIKNEEKHLKEKRNTSENLTNLSHSSEVKNENVTILKEKQTKSRLNNKNKNYGKVKIKLQKTGIEKVLVWNKLSNADGYEVYRSKSKKGKYVKVDSLPRGSIRYKIKKSKINYYYKVRAYSGKKHKIYFQFSNVVQNKM